MNVTFDFAGVIDTDPERFAQIIKDLIKNGHNPAIVSIAENFNRAQLRLDFLKKYDLKIPCLVTIGKYKFETKKELIDKLSDLHIDDQPVFGKHKKEGRFYLYGKSSSTISIPSLFPQ